MLMQSHQSQVKDIDRDMWKVEHKPNNSSQPWSTLKLYDNKAKAMLYASSVSGDYYMIKVVDPDGSVVWGN